MDRGDAGVVLVDTSYWLLLDSSVVNQVYSFWEEMIQSLSLSVPSSSQLLLI